MADTSWKRMMGGTPAKQTTRRAALIEATDPRFGLNSLTIDTTTGLTWLDLNVTTGRSFVDVASELGDNGDFEGFRYATRAEILDLFDQFGFVDFQSPALNTSVFFALFGVTSMQDGNPEAMSWGADALTADWNIFGLDYFLGNGPGYRVYAGDQLWQNPTIAFASTGSFLVVVPEPTIVTLVGIGFLGACAAKRRGRKRV